MIRRPGAGRRMRANARRRSARSGCGICPPRRSPRGRGRRRGRRLPRRPRSGARRRESPRPIVLVEEQAGRRRAAAAHRLERAAAAIGDHRRAARLRLDRRDAEVLLGGEDERARTLHPVDQPLGALVAEPAHVGRQRALHASGFGAVADHDQATLGHRRERLDDERHALVRHQPRRAEVEVLLVAAQCEALDVDRRMDHLGLAPVGLADAACDEVRVGDEAVHTIGAALVPAAQVVQHQAHRRARQPALQPAGEPRFGEVLVLQVPGLAHRRVHVATCSWSGPVSTPLANAWLEEMTTS